MDVRKQYHVWPGATGIDAWDVDRLIGLSHDFPVTDVDVSTIAEVDAVYWFDETEAPTVRRVVEHLRLIEEVDLTHPIILGPDGRVMDGMHRIARAMLEGRSMIRAVRIREPPRAGLSQLRSVRASTRLTRGAQICCSGTGGRYVNRPPRNPRNTSGATTMHNAFASERSKSTTTLQLISFSGWSAVEDDRHGFDAGHHVLADALDVADDVEAGEPPQELGDHDARFAAGEVGAEAEVLGEPERDVRDRASASRRASRRAPDVVVTVRRRVEEAEVVALVDLLPVDLDVVERGAAHVGDR